MFQLDKIYTSWTWERFSRHVFYWLAWLLFYAVANSTYNNGGVWSWLKLELLIMCVKLPFTYMLLYYLLPNFLLAKRYFSFVVIFLLTATIGGVAIWALYYYIFNPCFFFYETDNFWTAKIHYKTIDLIYISSIPAGLKMYQRQSIHEKRASQLVEQKLGAELKLLKNQLHPHFLFNTLNNLYSMVLIQHPQAADVVVRLSDMMSYMLYECEKNSIELDKELENLQNYIELEKIRYGQRLDISFETAGPIESKSIAPLLLMPFVENAFKHGVGQSEQNAWVRINLWVKEEELVFLVENSLPEMEATENTPNVQSGIGLTNVKKRLELLYPKRHELEITHKETFLIQLKLDIRQ